MSELIVYNPKNNKTTAKSFLDFLPYPYNLSKTFENLFKSSLDNVLSEPNTFRFSGYIGQKTSYTKTTDYYLEEPSGEKTNYQLEPCLFSKNSDSETDYFTHYTDILNYLKYHGADITNPQRLLDTTSYSWTPPINMDMFVNYDQYYWIENLPQPQTQIYRIVSKQNYVFQQMFETQLANSYTITGQVEKVYLDNTVLSQSQYSIADNILKLTEETTPSRQLRVVYGIPHQIRIIVEDLPTHSIVLIDNREIIKGVTIDQNTIVISDQTLDIQSSVFRFSREFQVTVLNDEYYREYSIGSLTTQYALPPKQTGLHISVDNFELAAGIDYEIIGENLQLVNSFTGTLRIRSLLPQKIQSQKQYQINGVDLSCGHVVSFYGRGVWPTHYRNKRFVIEGVGRYIDLVPVRYSSDQMGWDFYQEMDEPNGGWDTFSWDQNTGYTGRKISGALVQVDDNAITQPEYITIDRSHRSRNPWSKTNKWFHRDVLTSQEIIDNAEFKARRPIIEFNRELSLWHYGDYARQDVDVVFQNIYVTSNTSYLQQYTKIASGLDYIFNTGFRFKPSDTQVYVDNELLSREQYEVSQDTVYLKIVPTSGQTVLVKSTGKYIEPSFRDFIAQYVNQDLQIFIDDQVVEHGLCVLVTKDIDPDIQGKVFEFKLSSITQNYSLVLICDGFDSEGDPQLGEKISVGNNQEYWFDGVVWQSVEQTKTSLNQTPLFDLYDGGQNSYSGYFYPNSNFRGSVVFSYTTGQYPIDNVLKIRAYNTIYGYNFYTDINQSITSDYPVDLSRFVRFLNHNNTVQYSNLYYRVHTQQHIVDIQTATSSEIVLDVVPTTILSVELDNKVLQSQYYEILDNVLYLNSNLDTDNKNIVVKYLSDHKPQRAFYSLPKNITHNPLNKPVTSGFRNQFYYHFAKNISLQSQLIGESTHHNNYRDTSRDPGLSDLLLQHDSGFTALSYLINNQKTDIFEIISFNQNQYVKFRNLFIKKVNEIWLSYQFDQDNYLLILQEILDQMSLGKNSDSQYFQSNVLWNCDLEQKQYYIPPSPAFCGLSPLYDVEIIRLNNRDFIQCHDGSKILCTGDDRDIIILTLEQQIFKSVDSWIQQHQHKIFRINDYVSTSWNNRDYSFEEYLEISSVFFEKWVYKNKISYRINKKFDPLDPWTWNYQGLDTLGHYHSGSWRRIYLNLFNTTTPHTTPWQILGLYQKPTWWDSQYGTSPYTINNTLMWRDIEQGIIRNPQAIEYTQERPGLMRIIPVDDQGQLQDPVQANIFLDNLSIDITGRNWQYGDLSEVEFAWMNSADWAFDHMAISILLKPSKAMTHMLFSKKYYLEDQLLNGNKTRDIFELPIHLVQNQDGTYANQTGLIQYISEFFVYKNYSLDSLNTRFKNSYVDLAYRCSGFINKTDMSAYSEVFGLIPDRNIKSYVYRSNVHQELRYSGIGITYNGQAFEVFGFDPLYPYFLISPSDRSGPSVQISLDSQKYNPYKSWTSNIYYAVSSVVEYNNSYWRCIKTHTSSTRFEEVFWSAIAKPVNPDFIPEYQNSLDVPDQRVYYGSTFDNLEDLYNFFIEYQRYLEKQGWVFDYIVDEKTQDFRTYGKTVLYWAISGIDAGSTIAISAFNSRAKFQSNMGYVDNIERIYRGHYSILDRNMVAIEPDFTEISRDQNTTIISSANGMYSITLRLRQIENILGFDSITDFGDIVYDEVFGTRSTRLKLNITKTLSWNGRLETPGYLLYGLKPEQMTLFSQNQIDLVDSGELVENAEKMTSDFQRYFDRDRVVQNIKEFQYSKHNTGYQLRSFWDALEITEANQYELYLALTKNKGKNHSIVNLLKSTVFASSQITLDEEWAWHRGDFGNNLINRLQFHIDGLTQNKFILQFVQNPVGWDTFSWDTDEFSNAKLTNVSQDQTQDLQQSRVQNREIGYYKLIDYVDQDNLVLKTQDPKWISRPTIFPSVTTKYYDMPLGHRGSVLPQDVQYSGFDFQDFNEDLQIASDVSIWTYDQNNEWQIRQSIGFDVFIKKIYSGESIPLLDTSDTVSANQYAVIELCDIDGNTVNPGTLLTDRSFVSFDQNLQIEDFDQKIFQPQDINITTALSSSGVQKTIDLQGQLSIEVNGFNVPANMVVPFVTSQDQDYTYLDVANRPKLHIWQSLKTTNISDLYTFQIHSEVWPNLPAYGSVLRIIYQNVNYDLEIKTSDILAWVSYVNTILPNDLILKYQNNFLTFETTTPYASIIFENIVNNPKQALGLQNHVNVYRYIDNCKIWTNTELDYKVYQKTRHRINISTIDRKVYLDDIQGLFWLDSCNLKNNLLTVNQNPESSILANDGLSLEFNRDYENTELVFDIYTVVRQKTPTVDLDRYRQIKIYKDNYPYILDLIDPRKLYIDQQSKNDLDYILDFDPAQYNSSEINKYQNSPNYWNQDQLGKYWWDTSTVVYYDYHALGLQQQKTQWGKLAPNARIDIYQWTRSTELPASDDDRIYNYLKYSTETTNDYLTGSQVTYYYYWQKVQDSKPLFKNLSTAEISQRIANPDPYVDWVAPLDSQNYICNIRNPLLANNAVMKIVIQNGDHQTDNILHHHDWLLFSFNSEDLIDIRIYQKFTQSLLGNYTYDLTRNITTYNFDSNTLIFSTEQYPELKNQKSDFCRLFFQDTNAYIYFGYFYYENNNIVIKNIDWQYSGSPHTPDLNNKTHLNFQANLSLLQSIPFDNLVDRDRIGTAKNQTLFLNNIQARKTFVESFNTLLISLDLKNQHYDFYNFLTSSQAYPASYTTIDSQIQLSALAPVEYQHVIVKNTDTDLRWQHRVFYQNIWQIFDQKAWDFTDVVQVSDWYLPGYSAVTKINWSFANILEKNKNEDRIHVGSIVKIRNGNWQLYEKVSPNTYKKVGEQNATVQLKSNFIQQINNTFAGRYAEQELHMLLEYIYTSTLSINNINQLISSLLNYAFNEQTNLDWCFKTSLISLHNYKEPLVQSPIKTQDKIPFFLEHLKEFKPFHVKLKKYNKIYTLEENIGLIISDFDLPVYNQDGSLIVLNAKNPDDLTKAQGSEQHVMWRNLYRHYEQNQNATNQYLQRVRKIKIKQKFDRLTTDILPDSGASLRIQNHYVPGEKQPAKNLKNLLNATYNGTYIKSVNYHNSAWDLYSWDINYWDNIEDSYVVDVIVQGGKKPAIVSYSNVQQTIFDLPKTIDEQEIEKIKVVKNNQELQYSVDYQLDSIDPHKSLILNQSLELSDKLYIAILGDTYVLDQVYRYITDGVQRIYTFEQSLNYANQIQVFVNNEFYSNYTVDLQTKTIEFNLPLPANQLLKILVLPNSIVNITGSQYNNPLADRAPEEQFNVYLSESFDYKIYQDGGFGAPPVIKNRYRAINQTTFGYDSRPQSIRSLLVFLNKQIIESNLYTVDWVNCQIVFLQPITGYVEIISFEIGTSDSNDWNGNSWDTDAWDTSTWDTSHVDYPILKKYRESYLRYIKNPDWNEFDLDTNQWDNGSVDEKITTIRNYRGLNQISPTADHNNEYFSQTSFSNTGIRDIKIAEGTNKIILNGTYDRKNLFVAVDGEPTDSYDLQNNHIVFGTTQNFIHVVAATGQHFSFIDQQNISLTSTILELSQSINYTNPPEFATLIFNNNQLLESQHIDTLYLNLDKTQYQLSKSCTADDLILEFEDNIVSWNIQISQDILTLDQPREGKLNIRYKNTGNYNFTDSKTIVFDQIYSDLKIITLNHNTTALPHKFSFDKKINNIYVLETLPYCGEYIFVWQDGKLLVQNQDYSLETLAYFLAQDVNQTDILNQQDKPAIRLNNNDFQSLVVWVWSGARSIPPNGYGYNGSNRHRNYYVLDNSLRFELDHDILSNNITSITAKRYDVDKLYSWPRISSGTLILGNALYSFEQISIEDNTITFTQVRYLHNRPHGNILDIASEFVTKQQLLDFSMDSNSELVALYGLDQNYNKTPLKYQIQNNKIVPNTIIDYDHYRMDFIDRNSTYVYKKGTTIQVLNNKHIDPKELYKFAQYSYDNSGWDNFSWDTSERPISITNTNSLLARKLKNNTATRKPSTQT